MLIKERSRDKKALQFGKIYIPRASRHIFILSNERGWVKSVILSDLDIFKRMKGVMLTAGRTLGNLYMPMATPVIMNRYDKIEDHMTGAIAPGSRSYEEYGSDLAAVEQEQFARRIAVSES